MHDRCFFFSSFFVFAGFVHVLGREDFLGDAPHSSFVYHRRNFLATRSSSMFKQERATAVSREGQVWAGNVFLGISLSTIIFLYRRDGGHAHCTRVSGISTRMHIVQFLHACALFFNRIERFLDPYC